MFLVFKKSRFLIKYLILRGFCQYFGVGTFYFSLFLIANEIETVKRKYGQKCIGGILNTMFWFLKKTDLRQNTSF